MENLPINIATSLLSSHYYKLIKRIIKNNDSTREDGGEKIEQKSYSKRGYEVSLMPPTHEKGPNEAHYRKSYKL